MLVDGWKVDGRTAKLVTTVQDWVSTFENVKPLDFFRETSVHTQLSLK